METLCDLQVSAKYYIVTKSKSYARFSENIAESISLPLPDCLPNFRDERIQLLLTDMTKMNVYYKYCKASEEQGMKPEGSNTFLDFGTSNCFTSQL